MQRISRYTLLEHLGSGAFSEVFVAEVDEQSLSASPELRARTSAARGRVAVKVLKPRFARDSAFAALLAREGEAAVRFRHPSAAGVLEVASDGGELFVAMELVRGRTLADLLRRAREEHRPIAREIALWIAAETASVLRAAHLMPWASDTNERMVHGEVTPSNILITWEGRVKLLSVGLGRSRSLLQPSLDRVAYRAPELLESTAFSQLSDVYALGVMIYDAFTNAQVFARSTQAETEAAVLRGKFDRLGGRVNYISELVNELVWQMMSRFPESRPQSAEYVERALRSQVRFSEEVIAGRIAEHMRRTFARELHAEHALFARLDGELPDALEVDVDALIPIDEAPIDADTLPPVRSAGAGGGGKPRAPAPPPPSSDHGFGGKTEPMAQLAPPLQSAPRVTSSSPPPPERTEDLGLDHFDDDTPFTPLPVEVSSAHDPFEENTPPLGADPVLALAAPSVARVPPPATSSKVDFPALPPPMIPSAAEDGPPPPVSPTMPLGRPISAALASATRDTARANTGRTDSTKVPLPRGPSQAAAPNASRPEPRPETSPAPLPRSASRTKEVVEPPRTPAPTAKPSGDLLAASNLLADLLDTIDAAEKAEVKAQPKPRTPSVAERRPPEPAPAKTPPRPAPARARGASVAGADKARDMSSTSSGAAPIAGGPGPRGTSVRGIGRYEIVAEVGRAGAALVLDARVPPSTDLVQLKILDTARIDDGRLKPEEWVACFGREVAIARKLAHRGLPRLLEAGQEGTVQYIAYDRVEGIPLSAIVGRGKLLDAETVRRIIAQLAQALAYLHERGFVAANVQAQSVLVTRDGYARLNNLSLAASAAGPAHPLLSRNVFVLSPEYLGGRGYGPESDQFALGALLYELLTNTRPFRGLDDRTIVAAIHDKDPIPPQSLDSRVNPFLSDVAMRALAKDPAERFASCDALAKYLVP